MTIEIRKKYLGSLLDNGEANYRLAMKQGAIDGAADLPSPDSAKLSAWEEKFLDSSRAAWGSYQAMMKIERERGLSDFSAMSEKLERDSTRAEESIGSRQKKALDLLESEMGESSLTYRRLKGEYDEKRDAGLELEKKLGRPLQVSLVKGYMPLMIVLALAEVQVNRLAFELFFESMPAVSLLLAAAVGALLMFFAHIVGKQYRHTQCPITVKDKNGMFLGIVGILVVCFVLMYFLGVMREELVRVQNAGQITLEDMSLDDLAKGGAKGAGFSLALGTTGTFLLLLNFVIFLTGLVGSYFRHDSHPYFEKTVSLFEKAKKAFYQHQATFENRQVEILRGFSAEMVKSDSELAEREAQIAEISRKRSLVDRDVTAAKDSLTVEVARCLRAYRAENLSSRRSPPPAYFTESVEVLAQEIVRL
jgi:hypothetical protein